MGKNKAKRLREKGIELKNNATTVLLPSVINNTILIEASLVVLLATLAEPTVDTISLYRSLLCTLLSSIVFGVFCTSAITIDFYNLGNKVLDRAKKSGKEDKKENLIRTGNVPRNLIIGSFILCLLLFIISIVQLVFYAW